MVDLFLGFHGFPTLYLNLTTIVFWHDRPFKFTINHQGFIHFSPILCWSKAIVLKPRNDPKPPKMPWLFTAFPNRSSKCLERLRENVVSKPYLCYILLYSYIALPLFWMLVAVSWIEKKMEGQGPLSGMTVWAPTWAHCISSCHSPGYYGTMELWWTIELSSIYIYHRYIV